MSELRAYVEYVVDAFEIDEEAGFHSRDRAFALDLLCIGLRTEDEAHQAYSARFGDSA